MPSNANTGPHYTSSSSLVKEGTSHNLATRYGLDGSENFNQLLPLLLDDLNNCNIKDDLGHVIEGLKKLSKMHKGDMDNQQQTLKSQINELKVEKRKSTKEREKKEKELIKQVKKDTVEEIKARRRSTNALNALQAPLLLDGRLAALIGCDESETITRQLLMSKFYKIEGVSTLKNRDLDLPDEVKEVLGPAIHARSSKDTELCYSFFNRKSYRTCPL